MVRSAASALLVALALAACGGETTSTRAVDESDDLARATSVGTSGGSAARREASIPTGVGGTVWRFAEAHCTEGPLDLSARGFSSRLRVEEDGANLLLVSDHTYATESCHQTVVQRVAPGSGGDLALEEIARVSIPSTAECFGQPEAPRPGDVRLEGRRLEVLIQRSRWCGGFEARFVYDPELPQLLTPDELARLYAVHFSLGDADRVAGLFAQTGSLLEPFTRTGTGDPYRHDGREAVRAWFADSFASASWRALRIVALEHPSERRVTLRWEYMDPRLSQPLAGHNEFTVAAGEIFESQIVLDAAPVLLPPIATP
jgi:hypothetical protein